MDAHAHSPPACVDHEKKGTRRGEKKEEKESRGAKYRSEEKNRRKKEREGEKGRDARDEKGRNKRETKRGKEGNREGGKPVQKVSLQVRSETALEPTFPVRYSLFVLFR